MLRLAEVDLPGLAGVTRVRAPACAEVAIVAVLREVVLVLLLAARGGLARHRQVPLLAQPAGDPGLRPSPGRLRSRSKVHRDERADRIVGFLRARGKARLGVPVAGPEQPLGNHVEVLRLGHGLVVVANGGGEDLAITVAVGPDADLGLVVAPAVGLPEHRGAVKDLDRVVELSLGRDKLAAKPFHDGMRRLNVIDRKRIVRTMSGRLHADKLKPLVVSCAIAVHGAVDQQRRQALAMRADDVVDEILVLDRGKALVVHHDIKALGPVTVLVQRYLRIRGAPSLAGDGPDHVGPGGDTSCQDQLLAVVVMTAPARDKQGLDRLCLAGRGLPALLGDGRGGGPCSENQ